MFRFYKPKSWIIIVDVLIIMLNAFFVFVFLPLTTPTPFKKYSIPLLIFIASWVLISYFLERYRKTMNYSFFKSISKLIGAFLLVAVVFGGIIFIQPQSPYSENILITILIGVFLTEYLFIFFYFAFRYATQYEAETLEHRDRVGEKPLVTHRLSNDAIYERSKRIEEFAGNKVLKFCEKNCDLFDSGAFVMTGTACCEENGNSAEEFNTIIQLKRLNKIRGINDMFVRISEKLQNNGTLVCCYKSQSTIKKKIFKKYPRLIAHVYYFFHFLIHRLFPKVFFTHRLYYDLTDGRDRSLSKTEVLGRLIYCGFKIERVAKVGDDHYVFARRVHNPEPQTQRYYGALIKLKRYGANGKLFNVYKFRTMHPYAEFLQDYVYEQNSLAEGGKFKHDIRVSTVGRFMRKYWIDELPMLFNVLFGDMKLVGVRPLSMQYFKLYSEELQQLRIRHKPGLLPPFYAHMPKTLEEIENSEKTYLLECEKNGTGITDVKYFFLILKNIIFGKARSA